MRPGCSIQTSGVYQRNGLITNKSANFSHSRDARRASNERLVASEDEVTTRMATTHIADNLSTPPPLRIRDDQPFTAWRSGDKQSASRLLTKYFDLFRSADPTQPVSGDFYTLEYLQLLIHHGLFEDASKLLRRVGPIWPLVKDHFYTLDKIIAFVLPQISSRLPNPDRERLFINLPIWGEQYLEIFEKGTLPALTDPGSSTLFDGKDVEFHIFTKAADKPALAAMPEMARLEQRAKIRWFSLDTILTTHEKRNIDAMNIAQWCSLTLARHEKASLMLLFADYITAKGSLGNLGRSIDEYKNDIFFTIDIQFNGDAWNFLCDPHKYPDGPANVASAGFSDLFPLHASARERSWLFFPKTKDVPGNPIRLSIFEEDYVEIRNMYPQPIYFTTNLLENFFAHTPMVLDRFTVETAMAALGGTDRMAVLNDPEWFLGATFDFNAEPKTHSYVPATDMIDETMKRISKKELATEARHWAIRSPLLLGKKSKDNVLDKISENFSSRRNENSSEMSNYLEFCHDALIPTFKKTHMEE